jgi:Molybdopterin-binding domain of aldehyde dehydrogenase
VLPFIAHVPTEPRAAAASWDDKGLTVHCGSQVPFGVRKQLADAFGMNERDVRVVVPATGTGFGGKHGPEVALEAAKLARAAGKPIRVAWTREDEFVRSYCRPAALIEVRGGLAGGRIAAWDFHNYNSGPASLLPPYAISDYWCGFRRAVAARRIPLAGRRRQYIRPRDARRRVGCAGGAGSRRISDAQCGERPPARSDRMRGRGLWMGQDPPHRRYSTESRRPCACAAW